MTFSAPRRSEEPPLSSALLGSRILKRLLKEEDFDDKYSLRFALGTLYFGLSLHMPQFDANIYLIFFLSGLVEIPADIIPFVLLNKYGRRPNLSLHYIIGGLLCMATAAVPLGVYSYEWPIVVLAMLGKYVAQVCWGIVYLYTSELFPTVIRSVALSFACSMARIGSMAAPFIAYLSEVHPVLPIFVFGSITFAVGRLTFPSLISLWWPCRWV